MRPNPEASSVRRTTLAVGLSGLAIGLLIALRLLSAHSWDPTVFLAFGEDSTAIDEYARTRLGDITVRADIGHDGRFFFVQATDPWITDRAVAADLLEPPRYRAQRMLYPLLASGFGLLPDAFLPWTLLGLNLIALGIGSWALAVLAVRLGASRWVGLIFAVNPGNILEIQIGGAGVVALMFFMLGLLQLEKYRSVVPAGLWFAASVLTREVMILMVIGSAAFWLRQKSRVPWALLVLPAVAAGSWALYLRAVLPAGPTVSYAVGWPLVGLWEAAQVWVHLPLDLVVGSALLIMLIVFSFRAVQNPSFLSWGALGMVLLVPLLTKLVWLRFFDFARAIAPVLPAYALLIAPRRTEADEPD